MAYENINVSSAKAAINSCLNSIRHETSNEITGSLSASSEWISDSKTTFVGSVKKLVDVRYKELKDYLKQCLGTLDKIQEYKDLQAKNKSIDSSISSVSNRLSNARYKYNQMSDKTTSEAKSKKRDIDNYERELSSLKSQRQSNINKMNQIQQSINVT